MFKNKSEMQKAGIAVCIVLIIFSGIFGVIMRFGYSRMSQDKKNIENALFSLTSEEAQYIDYASKEMSFDALKYELDYYSNAFIGKCAAAEICYNCIKYTFNVSKTIKGDENETGKNIIVYQWIGLDVLSRDRLIITNYDFSMPMKLNDEYLIFAIKRDYYEGYQKTLKYNEYSLGLRSSSGPSAFVINKTQKRFVDINSDLSYKNFSDIYYLCFSQEALDRINQVAKQIIEEYC